MNPAKFVYSALDKTLAIGGAGNVAFFEDCPAAGADDFVRYRLSALPIYVGDGDRRTFAGEQLRGRTSDAGCASRNERGLAVKLGARHISCGRKWRGFSRDFDASCYYLAMDLLQLRVFQSQIQLQCEAALKASDDLEAALKRNDVSGAFCAIQSLLTAAA